MDYREFFSKLTGKQPFPYQEQLAQGAWPDRLDVPTGLGKTAAVVVAWLWRRRQHPASTPRRLVFCLPMRVLVRQTLDVVQKWVDNAEGCFPAERPEVRLLMGGDLNRDWDRFPEKAAILIGTQDMLLSRALNRGYAQSRYRWPVGFGLLNADCLWVFDETQLMGVGVETSAQLQGLREKLGTVVPTTSLWMSATPSAEQMNTVDHPAPEEGLRTLELSPHDIANSHVQTRVSASKSLLRSSLALDKANAKADYAKALSAVVLQSHQPDTLTLVVLNQVQRAQELFQHLRKARPNEKLLLLHSRFRPHEREPREAELRSLTNGIVVSTQVVEAGVDISSQTLITELAPWSSLVQRFGRCNRYGLQDEAQVIWVDIAADADQGPYEQADLDAARAQLERLSNAAVETVRSCRVPVRDVIRPVIRRKDIVELFDTTPDLSGSDIDVSMYIRDGDDHDVHVYWRKLPEDRPVDTLPEPAREELCPVPVGAFREFANKSAAWSWNALDKRYATARNESIRPGQVFLVSTESGGYDPDVGWVGTRGKAVVAPVASTPDQPAVAMDDDRDTCIHRWVSLQEHLDDVTRECTALCRELALDEVTSQTLQSAAEWHDVGKAHTAFQRALGKDSGLWAKSDCPTSRLDYRDEQGRSRVGFRHELASALAWLQHDGESVDSDLVAYLIASHHGKVRMSIRSMPNEAPPDDVLLSARGVWHGDGLPAIPERLLDPITLDLSLMKIGPRSWLERMTRLRETWGPFKLAYLEAVLRIADWRASQLEMEVVAR